MVDFDQATRKRCRHCKMRLPEPTSNEREAFCTRGCYRSFFLHRCIVCEKPIERTTASRKICKKSDCRSALRAGLGFGRYHGNSTKTYQSLKNAELMQEVPLPQRSASASEPVEKSLEGGPRQALGQSATPWLQKGLAKPTKDKPAWRWRRMLGPNGEAREDDDWELFDRDGKMAARVRQEGDGYWVARPRTTPEPPIEGFEAACRRAVNVAMMTLDWPASERHPVHPGMLAAQFDATKRDLARKHPHWSAKEVHDYIVGILKPSTRQDGCLIKRDGPPVNIVGGYRFPDAPVIDLNPIEPKSQVIALKPAATRPGLVIPDDLSIPAFLLRRQEPLAKAA
jgi:hypothetical protein